MGIARQLKLFATFQVKCVECASKFVPFSKDIIRVWDNEGHNDYDWLSSRNWAIDRLYQDNSVCCSVECLDVHLRREVELQYARIINRAIKHKL